MASPSTGKSTKSHLGLNVALLSFVLLLLCCGTGRWGLMSVRGWLQENLSSSRGLVGWSEGAQGYGEAFRRHELGVPLLIYVYTDWCGYCRRFERDVLSSELVSEGLRGVAAVRINPEIGSAERSISDELRVRGFPSVFVVSGPGAAAIEIPIRPDLTPEGFLESIATVRDPWSVRSGWEALERGDAEAAVEALDLALATDPHDAEALYWRGNAHYKRNDRDRALRDFEAAIFADPTRIASYDWAATICMDLKRTDQAIRHIDQIIAREPEYKNGRAYYLRAVARRTKGDHAGAAADIERACNLGHPTACRLGAQN